MSFLNTNEEKLVGEEPTVVPVCTDAEPHSAAEPELVPATVSQCAEEVREDFHTPQKNGLSIAVALATVAQGEGLPEINLVWENPLADTFNVRERKLRVAEELGERFPKTGGALSRAAGAIKASRWSTPWQQTTEKAAKKLSATADALAEASANFAVATGLIPSGGTVRAISDLQKLVGALFAVRGENPSLVLDKSTELTLSRLREAASLVENCARHKSLLSLKYPENASENPELESWLKTWNEAEFSRSFPRWMKRRKVVAALRKLAGCSTQSPLDPRVDLGNLIALRTCKAEFSGKFSDLSKAFPSLLPGMNPCGALARIASLEKARRAVEGALTQLEFVPEKREAWQAVISRWLGGNDVAFAKSGVVETIFREVESSLAEFGEARARLAELLGAEPWEQNIFGETPEAAKTFAESLLADRECWRDICLWNSSALAAARRGMSALVDALLAGTLEAADAKRAFDVAYCKCWAEAAAKS